MLFKDKINFKEPGGAGFDSAPGPTGRLVGVRADVRHGAGLASTPPTIENGCLEMADAPRLGALIGQEWTPLTPAQMAAFTLVPVPGAPGDVLFFDSYAPHASKPNLTASQRRILYLTYNLARDGDHRRAYFAAKRASFPPDVEREPGKDYTFRV